MNNTLRCHFIVIALLNVMGSHAMATPTSYNVDNAVHMKNDTTAQSVEANNKRKETLISMPTRSAPEPETYATLLVGLGLIGLSTRQRKNDNYD